MHHRLLLKQNDDEMIIVKCPSCMSTRLPLLARWLIFVLLENDHAGTSPDNFCLFDSHTNNNNNNNNTAQPHITARNRMLPHNQMGRLFLMAHRRKPPEVNVSCEPYHSHKTCKTTLYADTHASANRTQHTTHSAHITDKHPSSSHCKYLFSSILTICRPFTQLWCKVYHHSLFIHAP